MIRRYDGRVLLVDTQRKPFAFTVGLTRIFTVFLLGAGWTNVGQRNRTLRHGALVVSIPHLRDVVVGW